MPATKSRCATDSVGFSGLLRLQFGNLCLISYPRRPSVETRMPSGFHVNCDSMPPWRVSHVQSLRWVVRRRLALARLSAVATKACPVLGRLRGRRHGGRTHGNSVAMASSTLFGSRANAERSHKQVAPRYSAAMSSTQPVTVTRSLANAFRLGLGSAPARMTFTFG